MASSAPSALLPLRVEIEHLDALEGLALRADRAALSMKASSSSSEDSWRAQVDARFNALAIDRDRAVREALIRLQSWHFSEARTAAWALGVLRPESCRDARGRVVLQSRCPAGVLDGLARAPSEAAPSIDDPASIQLAALRGDVPEGLLLAVLGSRDARARGSSWLDARADSQCGPRP